MELNLFGIFYPDVFLFGFLVFYVSLEFRITDRQADCQCLSLEEAGTRRWIHLINSLVSIIRHR